MFVKMKLLFRSVLQLTESETTDLNISGASHFKSHLIYKYSHWWLAAKLNNLDVISCMCIKD